MLKWSLVVVVAVGGLVGLVAIVGMMLPKGHRASRTATLAAPPGVVFGVITDFVRGPEWRRGITHVDVVPDDGRGRVVRERSRQGVVPYRVETFEPPARLVMRIDDRSLPYGGSWTYELQAAGTGTTVTITEEGEVYNPIFRFMQKVFFSPYVSIDGYLEDLERRLARS
ncbi:MAG TPA: SRPBCC family protein [Vicinamibacterales bacterium]|nr:SRPBCC family protein [Vicinamibacterales bacterium]